MGIDGRTLAREPCARYLRCTMTFPRCAAAAQRLPDLPLAFLRMPTPKDITLHALSRVLEIAFDDGSTFRLPFEFLRVHSPSAEVKGHGRGQETLQVGKRDVTIDSLQPVGHYALQLAFSDGHDSGIYSWDYLYELGASQERLWAEYLAQLEEAGASRDAAPGDAAPAARGCGHH